LIYLVLGHRSRPVGGLWRACSFRLQKSVVRWWDGGNIPHRRHHLCSCYPRHKVFLRALVIPTSFLFARHLPNAKSFLRLQPKKPTHRCRESLTSIRSWRSNQQETDAPSILPARAGVATIPSARIGRKTDKVFTFLSTVNIFGNKESVKLSKFYCHHDQFITNLLPIATNTSIFGETEPNPTPAPVLNLKECAHYTLYANNPSPHCIGKLTNYFAFPNVKLVLRELYEMKPKVRS
jgi:hypothetical protein